MDNSRFKDENKRLYDFQNNASVECPSCQRQAAATVNYEAKSARLICPHCGYNRTESTTSPNNTHISYLQVAHSYFGAKLWYQHPFGDDTFWAYNINHLVYLEQYIGAKLREHQDRTGFTLIERLPKFYHDAKNRKELLRIISRLKNKVK